MSFATQLAAMPDLLARALAEHVPDDQGRCRECREAGNAAAWPCAMRMLAEEASGMNGAAPAQAPPPTAPPTSSAPQAAPSVAEESQPVVDDPAADTDEWDAFAYRRALRREGSHYYR